MNNNHHHLSLYSMGLGSKESSNSTSDFHFSSPPNLHHNLNGSSLDLSSALNHNHDSSGCYGYYKARNDTNFLKIKNNFLKSLWKS